ncbi:MAG: HNH endonuclease family protein [Candidatus Saccharimonadaceae bacterium]|nr:HNH endonuclease family protein [Candidatus Saccharimonadaceae bacterium]
MIFLNTPTQIKIYTDESNDKTNTSSKKAIEVLNKLTIKGRAPKTGYSRDQFGIGWLVKNGCDMRNIILNRDLKNVMIDIDCNVTSGVLEDPYTGKTISFLRGSNTSDDVQIDHIVALSDAWQKGAQQLSREKRIELANDPLELIAVDGTANQQKGDGDAATWLPSNKSFRCQYVARQIAVKYKYNLWVTQAEYDAIKNVLSKCPDQLLPNP